MMSSNAVGEIFLFGIAAHVLERQYGDRRLVRQREPRPLRCRRTRLRGNRAQRHLPDLHRLGDVLQVLQSKIVVGHIDLAANLPVGVIRDANAAGIGNALQPRRDIDAVAEDIAVIDDDVADMDADADIDPYVGLHIRVLSGHAALDFDGAAQRVHGAGKLDQHAVTGGLHNASAMLGDGRIDQRLPDCFQPRQRSFLVGAHEAAIAGDIGCQNRRETPLYPFHCQNGLDATRPGQSKHVGPPPG